MNEHVHDYGNAIRKGRAHYVCPECGQDITLELCLLADCGYDLPKPETTPRQAGRQMESLK